MAEWQLVARTGVSAMPTLTQSVRRLKLEGRRICRVPPNIDGKQVVSGPAVWDVSYAGCKKAQDFTSVGLPTGEGIGR